MGYVEQLAKKGAKLTESGHGFADPVTHQKLGLGQLVLGEGDCHGDGFELEAKPHHSLSWWRGIVRHLP